MRDVVSPPSSQGETPLHLSMGFRASPAELIPISTQVPLVPHHFLFPTLLAAVPDLDTNPFFKCKSSPTLAHCFPHSQLPALSSPQILSSLPVCLHPPIRRSHHCSVTHSSISPLPQHPFPHTFWILSCIQFSFHHPFGTVHLSP